MQLAINFRSHPTIAFLRGEGEDQSGRTLDDYLAFSAPKWEECHDHMQWAFPTNTKSAFNPNAPVIPDDFEFNGDERVVRNIEQLLAHYLLSLGIGFTYDTVFGYTFTFPSKWNEMPVVDANGMLTDNRPKWANSRDHNVLRMTRILECLGIFGMTELQEALHDFLVYTIVPIARNNINGQTVAFWVAAKDNKLNRLR